MTIMDIILNLQRYSTEVLAYKLDAEFAAAVDAAANHAAAIGKLTETPKWIPVTERLPVPDKQVLAIVSGRWENIMFDRAYELASWSVDEGWIMEAWPELEDPEVSHWMPLPEPPKEKT